MAYTQKEIKIWCGRFGYTFEKTKEDDGSAIYKWTKIDSDPTISGSATSLSKFVTQVYNHMTDNKFVEHQKEHKKRMDNGEIDYDQGIY